MGITRQRVTQWWRTLRGQPMQLDLTPQRSVVAAAWQLEEEMRMLADADLRDRFHGLQEPMLATGPVETVLGPAFAIVREAAWRALGVRAFDEQLLGAAVLSAGRVAEMHTGEGKTLVAVFAAAVHALLCRGVHVLTVNDYLARRDAVWMGPVYGRLGVQVGFALEGMSAADKRAAYASDVTYATAKEAGFDYLRDQLALGVDAVVHRDVLHFAIIDEVDSILIDEARVPLVIAGAEHSDLIDLGAIARLVRTFKREQDYRTDEYARNAFLTDAGIDCIERALGGGSLHAEENVALLAAVTHALHAAVLLRRDVDYLVRDDRIEIVDPLTGRVALDRRYPDGLQAGVAAKEGLSPPREGTILGSITMHHFAGLYSGLAGMTGTAQDASRELLDQYGLPLTVIPPHRPVRRIDEPDRVFVTRADKEAALIANIVAEHATGRPILVGTATVDESERLAAALLRLGVACELLNARHPAREAEIIAGAGARAGLTISTNMAGRGTDIRLGGPDGVDAAQVSELGGLLVIGTNRHESRRIDDQLRGRAGRQGDPGASRFFVSITDDLVQRFGFQRLFPERPEVAADGSFTDRAAAREIARAQRIVEGQNHKIRRMSRRYAAVAEHQRRCVQERRREILLGASRGLLAARVPGQAAECLRLLGSAGLQQLERHLLLHEIDGGWAEQLERLTRLKETLYLAAAANFDPLLAYSLAAGESFAAMEQAMDDRVVATFARLRVDAAGIDLEFAGVRGPASTWTYLLDDNPFGTPYERLLRGLGHRGRRWLRRSRSDALPGDASPGRDARVAACDAVDTADHAEDDPL